MLLVSLNSGQTFVASNVNITAKNCTKKDNETESGGETKPEVTSEVTAEVTAEVTCPGLLIFINS